MDAAQTAAIGHALVLKQAGVDPDPPQLLRRGGALPYPQPEAEQPEIGQTQHASWARLLKRVFEIDPDHCRHGGGALRIMAAIVETAVIVIERLLTHSGLAARLLPRSPARAQQPLLQAA